MKKNIRLISKATFILIVLLSTYSFKTTKNKIEDPNDFAEKIFNHIVTNDFEGLNNYIAKKIDVTELIEKSLLTSNEREEAFEDINTKYEVINSEATTSIRKLKKEMELSNIDLKKTKLYDISFRIKQEKNIRTGKITLKIKDDKHTFKISIKRCFIINNHWETLEGFSISFDEYTD